MDLRQLAQFVAVAETLSFRRAAERLFMAQPPLSVAVRKLEESIGAPLLIRSNRGVRLTPAGEAALVAARRCLRDAEEVRSEALAAAQGEIGSLRIGFIGSVTYGLLPRLIRAFRHRHPRVKLELHEGTNLDLVGAVESRTLDLGFVRVPMARPQGLAFQMVQHDSFMAAVPQAHALARRKTLSLRDFADEAYIGYTPSHVGGLQAAAMQLFIQSGISPALTQEAVQVHTVIGLVESGLGIALVPSINAPHAPRGVVFKPIRDLPMGPSIGIALVSREEESSTVVQRFKAVTATLMEA